MSRRFRSYLLLAVLAGATSCDASVAGIDGVDAGHIERLSRITTRSLTPVERALLDTFVGLGESGPSPAIPQLQRLFELSLESEAGHALDAAESIRRQHEDAVSQAWAAIDAGQDGAGERALVEARAMQVKWTAELMGPMAVRAYVAVLGASLDRVEESSGSPQWGHRLDSARNLTADARTAIATGDLAAAIDIASHAAGLANTLRTMAPAR